ncbi:oligosaccharyl transferase, archaeosortase A system-associated [Salinarchaeum laminariae]|uniref:oligosaccharyl transferase, archaeosortase A system-associated n=1 Tax=Salinarchaeum laminariae TaxID=869888 RepID=UPI0020BDD5A4|nr:oligosaccharyl transferase, archaeosortase A system-associated [Salinarchaeum laminariae]
MSADAEQDGRSESEAVLDRLHDWYHVPLLAAILGVMLWFRTRAYDHFVQSDTVYFGGNDPYYHYRATMYSVENWPRRLYGDAWTHFPFGGNVGNFGSLMDQTVATVALVVGLGDPSARQVAIVAVLAPAVIGALCVFLVYCIGNRLSGHRIGGITAAAVLALVPQNSWVRRSTAGFYDHHVAEAFMMAAAILAMLYALDTVRRERPVYEQLLDRDWDGLRPTLQASAAAGVVMGLYLHVWAPGIVLGGIFGVFFLVAMSLLVVRGESPEHLAFAGAISMTVAALTILPWTLSLEFSSAQMSLLQVVILLGVAVGCVVMAALSRFWDDEGYDPNLYPAAVGSLVVLGLAVMWFLLPEAWASLEGGISRVVPMGQSDTLGTVSEAQPTGWDNFGEKFYDGYGFTFFTALAAAAVMTVRATLADRPRSDYLLIVVWSAFVFSMAMSQTRFHYYLVLAVAVLNGWLVVQALELASLPSLQTIENVEAYHVLTVLAVLTILFVPIASPIAATTAAEQSENNGPGSVAFWQDNLDWMEENTPEPGTFGGADNEMSYYGPYDEINDYEYPEGAYGVMSWWDYGHWITVEGERIPIANPFQEGPRTASSYFQETNETRANMYLEALPSDEISGGQLYGANESELQAAIDARTEQEAGEETRYVMIDDQMVGGKFSAITEWTGPGASAYTSLQEFPAGNDSVSLQALNEQYDSTMLSRMYFNDGSTVGQADADALEHYRLVYESPTQSTVLSVAQQTENGLRSTGLTGIDIGTLQQYYPGVYNSINSPGGSFVPYDVRSESAVKTFERVEGATLTGEAEPNHTVQASVQLETNTGRTFTYAQATVVGESGQFEITVPYATTNGLGPDDGYTNSSVIANGSYTVSSGTFVNVTAEAENVSVTEQAVYDGETIDVDLEEVETNGTDGTNGGNQSTGNETSTDAVSGSSTDTASGSSTDTASGASTSISSASGSSAAPVTGSPVSPTASASTAASTSMSTSTAVTATDWAALAPNEALTVGQDALGDSLEASVRSITDLPTDLPFAG